MNRHLLTRRALPMLVASLALGTAGASTALANVTTASGSDGTLSITDASNNDNYILVKRLTDTGPDTSCIGAPGTCATTRQRIRVQDRAGIPGQLPGGYQVQPGGNLNPLAGAGCVAPLATDPDYADNSIICTATSPSGQFTLIDAKLNGGNDYFSPTDQQATPAGSVDELRLPRMQLDGGADNDVLRGYDYTNDTLIAGDGQNELFGRGGSDTFKLSNGKDRVVGDDGNALDGNADTVDYSSQSAPVRVDLMPDSSGSTHSDSGVNCAPSPTAGNCATSQIYPNIENVLTGSGNDVVIAQTDTVNRIITGAGDDKVYGNGGSTTLNSGTQNGFQGYKGDTIDIGSGSNVVDTKNLMTTPSLGNDVLDTSVTKNAQDHITATSNATAIADGTTWVGGANDTNDVTTGDGSDYVKLGDSVNTVTMGAGDGDYAETGNAADTITVGIGNEVQVLAKNGDNVVKVGLGAVAPTSGTHPRVTVGDGNDNVAVGDGNNVIVTDNGTTAGKHNVITVGNGANDPNGSGLPYNINTAAGDDDITTGNGGDSVDAGNGNNNVTTGDGADWVKTGSGTDIVTVNGGIDNVNDKGGNGNKVFGGAGDDIIDTSTVTAGSDEVYGGDGDDHLYTNGGNDYLQGGAGADDMNGGGPGDSDTVDYSDKHTDLYLSATGGNVKGQGEGCHADSTAQTQGCEHDTNTGMENVVGGSGNDSIYGAPDGSSDTTNNILMGNGGNDNLHGGGGDDKLFGDETTNGDINGKTYPLSGTAGDDTLAGGRGSDELHGGAGVDFTSYLDSADASYDSTGVTVSLDGHRNDGGASDDSTCSGSGCGEGHGDNLFPDIESIEGSQHDDTLIGADPTDTSNGQNTLKGMGGSDLLDGKGGADVLIGQGVANNDQHTPSTAIGKDDTGDTVTYAGRDGGVTATIALSDPNPLPTPEQCANAGGPTDTNTNQPMCDDGTTGSEHDFIANTVDNIIGGNGNDIIGGSDRIKGGGTEGPSNVLKGGPGDDTIDGHLGQDLIEGDDGNDTAVYNRAADKTVKAEPNGDSGSGWTDATGKVIEHDTIKADVENLRGGDEADHFIGNEKANVLDGGAGADLLEGAQANDTLLGGAGPDELHGGADNDTLNPGPPADTSANKIYGEGGIDTVDYHDFTAPVTVTFDNVANDGAGAQPDNVDNSVELAWLPGQPDPRPDSTTDNGNPAGGGPPPPAPDPNPNQTPPVTNTDNTKKDTTNTGSSVTTTTTTTPRDDSSATSVESTVTLLKATGGKAKSRVVLIRGRILVKARPGTAKGAASCTGGGKVMVTVTKGNTVVGKKLASLTKTCAFRAPVTLAKGTTGKLKVVVRFLGNRTLKASKRTTSLQVNG